ncbi:MAG TPA: C4-type zinc ribbon domain-containing protein [Bacteroidia bacterium]|nr:C4-type zinc ribbon domain-containing protein [Bacteroidia bacterium]
MIAEKKTAKAKATGEKKEKKPSTRTKLAEKKPVQEIKERRFNFDLKVFNKDKSEFTTEEKLYALFQLQLIDSEIDKIRIVRGELPMEVSDLEDEVAGLQTRLTNFTEEAAELQQSITQKKQSIKDSNALIKKYEAQQMNVKNNREFDSLNKEIEFQQLEIQLAQKRIKESEAELHDKIEVVAASTVTLDERSQDLAVKKSELDTIVAETQKEEEQLLQFREKATEMIDERLLTAYHRTRENARNGLAVVTIQRDACGGCFNKIPPQRQLDIRQHKKVIVCEHCGRILVDVNIGL